MKRRRARTRILLQAGVAITWLTLVPFLVLHGEEDKPAVPTKVDKEAQAYQEVINKTAAMVADPNVQKLAEAHGLKVLNITWEDTARFKDSVVGPNISDASIQIQQKDPETGMYRLTLMPVIRFPNFADKSADIAPEKFFLWVGNEKDKPLGKISLYEFLANPRKYLTRPGSWQGDHTHFLASRDTRVLVSAQACFLPVPKEGKAEFNPVLFNYQSVAGDPAVLTILATREGTSTTIIDNARDTFATGWAWGQRLFFNKNGKRASLTGERLSDFRASSGKPETGPEAAGEKGLNLVLLIQVPLKQKAAPPVPMGLPLAGGFNLGGGLNFGGGFGFGGGALGGANPGLASDVEASVIGHGDVEGPFTELAFLPVERDERYPIRVTVQFYKATSNGVVSKQDMQEIAEQINKVYADADFVGSLVTEGETGRPTEYDGEKIQPLDWWPKFWARYEKNTGMSRAEVIAKFYEVYGHNWFPLTEQSLADQACHPDFPENLVSFVPASATGNALPGPWKQAPQESTSGFWSRHLDAVATGTVVGLLALGLLFFLRRRRPVGPVEG